MNLKNILTVIVVMTVFGFVINTVNAADLSEINGVNEIWSGRYEGQLDWTHQPRLLKQTNVLEGRIGTSFGVFFSLQTEPQDAKGIVRLRYKTIFPEPGMLNPRTGTYSRAVEGVTECILGRACLAGYNIDTSEEVIHGEWSLVVSFRGKELLTKKFVIKSSAYHGNTGS
jgi:hypothetical protein